MLQNSVRDCAINSIRGYAKKFSEGGVILKVQWNHIWKGELKVMQSGEIIQPIEQI